MRIQWPPPVPLQSGAFGHSLHRLLPYAQNMDEVTQKREERKFQQRKCWEKREDQFRDKKEEGLDQIVAARSLARYWKQMQPSIAASARPRLHDE